MLHLIYALLVASSLQGVEEVASYIEEDGRGGRQFNAQYWEQEQMRTEPSGFKDVCQRYMHRIAYTRRLSCTESCGITSSSVQPESYDS